MVQANSGSEVSQRREKLIAQAEQELAKMDQFEIKLEEDNGNLVCRQAWNEETNMMMSYGEIKCVEGVTPEMFKRWIDEYPANALESNASFKEAKVIGEEDGCAVCWTEIYTPWPLSNRIMINTVYKNVNCGEDSHMILFSGEGNEKYVEQFFDKKAQKEFALAHLTISCILAKPAVKADTGVKGIQLLYVGSFDVGGNIPTFVANSKAPKTSKNTLMGPIDWIKKNCM